MKAMPTTNDKWWTGEYNEIIGDKGAVYVSLSAMTTKSPPSIRLTKRQHIQLKAFIAHVESQTLLNAQKTIREWNSFDSAPKDREILIRFPLQGNIVLLANWNKLKGYWQIKGEPRLGLENQQCLWVDIPFYDPKLEDTALSLTPRI